MKTEELRQKSKAELQRLLEEQRAKLQNLRFNLASGKVKNIREIRATKKDIARILTITNSKSFKSK